MRLSGIHHITAMARDGQATIAFYCRVLGLRLVKVTVNYDDPSSYHIYFGDHRGSPGTLLTFFLWPDAPRGMAERGQVERIAYSIPQGSHDFWRTRLVEHGVDHQAGEIISMLDPDGMRIDLIEADERAFEGIDTSRAVPAGGAIGRFCGATLAEHSTEQTALFLEQTLGMQRLEHDDDDDRWRLGLADGAVLELLQRPDARQRRTVMGPGVVHHIAFCAKDDAEQAAWRERLAEPHPPEQPAQPVRVTSVRERTYFRSIYFREPGGVLFEIATMQPGMTVDEPLEQLGCRLTLPTWLEKDREAIEARLPQLISPETGRPFKSSA